MDSLATNDFYILGLILLFPLLGAFINGVFGKLLPKQVVWFVACASIGLSFLFSALSVSTMTHRTKLGSEPHAVARTISKMRAEWVESQRALQEATAAAADAQARGEGEAAAQPPALDAELLAAETAAALFDGGKTPRAYLVPRLSYTPYDWIVSGDWASDEQGGWRPAAMIEAVGPQAPLHQRQSDASSPPRERGEPQPGIGGVFARLDATGPAFTDLNVRLGLALDPLSALLVLVITGVGFLIHLYSIGYMRHDPTKSRYFAYLNLFCFAMLLLVLGSNLVVLFVGWEGVGLCSYLLIGYYYDDHANADAGKKAFIVNRVGDFAFVLGMLTLFLTFGTLEFAELEAAVAGGTSRYLDMGVLTLATVLIFIGCTGKSAQLPLYVWLPDAMAGPTPVSALIHAATMVTAGVYLIARLNFLFILTPVTMLLIASVGAITAMFAASIALVQNDIKKVLAYSTVSQLGYMFLGIGVGAWWAAIFHLMTHAFFKALLFLGSGSVIDAMHHEQDIRKMGGLRKKMPITAWTFLIGCLAIAGFPLLAGFFSKDAILWATWFNANPVAPWAGWLLWPIGLATAGLTAFYMFRLYFLTFEGKTRAAPEVWAHVTESPASMTVPLVVLAILTVISGYLGVPHVLNFFHADLFETLPLWLGGVLHAPVETQALSHGAEVAAEWILMLASVGAGLLGIFVAWKFYHARPGDRPSTSPARLAERAPRAYDLLLNKYYVDELYDRLIVRSVLRVGTYSHALVDRVLIDILIVRMAGWTYQGLGLTLRYAQNGDLQRYAAYIMLGLLAVIYLVLF